MLQSGKISSSAVKFKLFSLFYFFIIDRFLFRYCVRVKKIHNFFFLWEERRGGERGGGGKIRRRKKEKKREKNDFVACVHTLK